VAVALFHDKLPEVVGSILARTQKTEDSNLHGFELHRPSSKGTKLLFQVIKATIKSNLRFLYIFLSDFANLWPSWYIFVAPRISEKEACIQFANVAFAAHFKSTKNALSVLKIQC